MATGGAAAAEDDKDNEDEDDDDDAGDFNGDGVPSATEHRRYSGHRTYSSSIDRVRIADFDFTQY